MLDADAVVRRLEAPGGAAVAPIAERFGRAVLSPEGGIDRNALAQRVFCDAGERRALEAIVHPLVREAAQAWAREAPSGAFSIFSAALLFECGWTEGWNGIVCVAASEGTQVRRMTVIRGMEEADARARLAAQMPVAEKARRATWTLWNDSDDFSALKAQVDALVAQWRTSSK